MRKAVLFNTNQVGGAERSLIEQLAQFSEKDIDLFIPDIQGDSKAMESLLRSKGFSRIMKYPYPRALYSLSRTGLFHPWKMISLVGVPFSVLRWGQILKSYDLLYLNGLKAALPVLLSYRFLKKDTRIVWHFRDYPSSGIFRILRKLWKKNITLVANSHSVRGELKKFFPEAKIETLYNLPGDLKKNRVEGISTIGIASMFAPWKGIHDVIWMASFYKEELQKLGIRKINIYGGNIYHTEGAHQGYEKEIRELATKLDLMGLIDFRGVVSPEIIFSEIDLLIHPSVEPEPFGRIIVEAFKSETPVISTGIGGAGELVVHGKTGLTYRPQDYSSLYKNIEKLSTDSTFRTTLINDAFQFWKTEEAKIAETALRLLRT